MLYFFGNSWKLDFKKESSAKGIANFTYKEWRLASYMI